MKQLSNKIKRYPYLSIGLTILLVSIVFDCNNEYTTRISTKCIVLDKIMASGGYKYSENFYLVLKDSNNVFFDILVSPATFSQTNIGETKIYNLKPMEIKQTPKLNILYFFLPVILFSLSISLIILEFFRHLFD